MNFFIDLLLADPKYNVKHISDLIHTSPFITDETKFQTAKAEILTIYKELCEKHTVDSVKIGFSLAERILSAGDSHNYNQFDYPDITEAMREAKAYRLLQAVLIIDPRIAYAVNEKGKNLLLIATEKCMSSMLELLLRYNKNEIQHEELALKTFNMGTPKLMAKFLTDESYKNIKELPNNNVSMVPYHFKLISFKNKNRQFNDLPNEVVVIGSLIASRYCIAYAHALTPYYRQLRAYYGWQEQVLKLRFGKLEESVSVDQTKNLKHATMQKVFDQKGIRDLIFSYCRPSLKKAQIKAEEACMEVLEPTENDLLMLHVLVGLGELPQNIDTFKIAALARKFFEDEVIKKPLLGPEVVSAPVLTLG